MPDLLDQLFSLSLDPAAPRNPVKAPKQKIRSFLTSRNRILQLQHRRRPQKRQE